MARMKPAGPRNKPAAARRSSSTEIRPQLDEIRAITLDLDDTLWPIAPVIQAAEHRLYQWLSRNCPRVARTHDIDSMREVRLLIARENQEIAHDVTEVRRRSLEHLIVENGEYPAELVDQAMTEFLNHRNQVELFPDVIPFLSLARAAFPLLSISNGNADLRRIGLDRLFVAHISATNVGAAKPDPRLFLAACAHLELAPQQVLHIGDHPVQDILGAAQVGMKTVWINRTGAQWDDAHRADHEVTSLEQIPDLLPSHRFGDPE